MVFVEPGKEVTTDFRAKGLLDELDVLGQLIGAKGGHKEGLESGYDVILEPFNVHHRQYPVVIGLEL